jgi:Swt1-like HEPN
MSVLDANGRVDKALRLLAPALQPIIERELRRAYRANWRQNLSVAYGSDPSQPLDAYGALKTMIDNWQSCFRDTFKQKTRTDVSKALDGRNAASHTSSEIPAADAISYLTGTEPAKPRTFAPATTLSRDSMNYAWLIVRKTKLPPTLLRRAVRILQFWTG